MKKLITIKELAAILNKSPTTIWRYHAKDDVLPPPIKVRGRVLGWRAEVIEAWLNEQN